MPKEGSPDSYRDQNSEGRILNAVRRGGSEGRMYKAEGIVWCLVFEVYNLKFFVCPPLADCCL